MTENTIYRGYEIEYNMYGLMEYTIFYNGDDVYFKDLATAQKFIDEITD